MLNLGDVPASSTLYIPFASYGKTNGESITVSGLAVTDIEIYKNGSVTQRASDNGYALLDTDGIDFDGITGLHGFSVDLSDNSDSGFYAVGSQYWVVVSTITVDSQTVTFIAARFRIRPAEAQAGYPKVDVQYVEGTDATDQIRDSVVDDSTRIDASALNTLSGHDPGETIMGATDLGTGSGLTSLATAAELAKVPKSDSNVTWNATAAAQIQSEANDALVANNLDHLLLSAVDTDLATTVHLNSVLGYVMDGGTAWSYDRTTDAMEVQGASHIIIDGNVSTIKASTDAILVDTNELQTDWTNGGRLDLIVDAILDDTGTAGVVVASGSKTGYSLVSTGLDLVTAWTVAITGNITGNLSGSVGSVTGAVGSVTGNVGGNVTGSVGSLATQAKADVNAEVLDVLATDTFAEPSAVVAATSSLKDKINWIFSLMRNKRTQTATTETLLRDDRTTSTATNTKSDDGTTLTRGEWT